MLATEPKLGARKKRERIACGHTGRGGYFLREGALFLASDLSVFLVAQDFAVLVHTHGHGVRGVVDARTPEHLPEIEGLLVTHVDAIAAKGEDIVLVRQLGAHRRERLNLGTQLVARLVVRGRHARQIEPHGKLCSA